MLDQERAPELGLLRVECKLFTVLHAAQCFALSPRSKAGQNGALPAESWGSSPESPSLRAWVSEFCHWGSTPSWRLLSLPCRVTGREQCPHLWRRKPGTRRAHPPTHPSFSEQDCSVLRMPCWPWPQRLLRMGQGSRRPRGGASGASSVSLPSVLSAPALSGSVALGAGLHTPAWAAGELARAQPREPHGHGHRGHARSPPQAGVWARPECLWRPWEEFL